MQYDQSAAYRQEQNKYGNDFIFQMKQAYHQANILGLIRKACAGHPHPRILEFGPGLGELTQLVLQHIPEADYTVLDIDTQILEQLKSQYEVQTLHIQNLDEFQQWQPDQKFQIIVGLDVWEHLPAGQVEGYTQHALALLDDGTFIAQVPNWGCPLTPNTIFAGDLTHYNHFNEFSAKQLLINAGANPRNIEIRPYRFPTGWIGSLRSAVRSFWLFGYKLSCYALGVPRLEIMTPNLIMTVKNR